MVPEKNPLDECKNLLKDKIAIVTGGGTGIGRGISLAMAKQGATVIPAARRMEKLEQVVAEIEAEGGKAKAIPVDLKNEQSIIKMVEEAIKAFGRIDVLVNNSGVSGPTCYLIDLQLKDWLDIIDTDLTGTMLVCREVLKHMMPAGSGSIVMIGAEGGRTGDGRSGYPLRASYCCAKMGVIGLTETLSRECGPYGIRVNNVSPAGTKNERLVEVMQGRADAAGITLEEAFADEMRYYSLGRPAEVWEIANATVFLASDLSSCITGQVIPAHAGLYHVGQDLFMLDFEERKAK